MNLYSCAHACTRGHDMVQYSSHSKTIGQTAKALHAHLLLRNSFIEIVEDVSEVANSIDFSQHIGQTDRGSDMTAHPTHNGREKE